MTTRFIFMLIALFSIQGCYFQTTTESEITEHKIGEHKLVIAHRGASGYLPEHSLAAKAMAYGSGVDYIEQDVVMTKDDKLVVLHDYYLHRVTDVMTVFPERYRLVDGNKHWFAIDFTLSEIKQLKMTEGFKLDPKSNTLIPNYPNRFPLFKSSFSVSTLEEEIELIQGLNHSTGKNIGLYLEIKAPWFHRHEGKDISKAALTVLKNYGYSNRQDKVFIQCFDPIETKRIYDQLMADIGVDFKLIQLIAQNDWNETMIYQQGTAVPYDYDWMLKPGGMAKIAEYADGVGPWKPMIISEDSTSDNLIISDLVKDAHAAGMKVHPYTFRNDPFLVPAYADNFEDMLDIFFYKVGVDGVFTDYPDLAVNFVRKKESR